MIVKQARLAQPLRGETSNIIDNIKYRLVFDKGMLHASLKNNPKKLGSFIVFPANIAWLEIEADGSEQEASQTTQEELKTARGRPRSNG